MARYRKVDISHDRNIERATPSRRRRRQNDGRISRKRLENDKYYGKRVLNVIQNDISSSESEERIYKTRKNLSKNHVDFNTPPQRCVFSGRNSRSYSTKDDTDFDSTPQRSNSRRQLNRCPKERDRENRRQIIDGSIYNFRTIPTRVTIQRVPRQTSQNDSSNFTLDTDTTGGDIPTVDEMSTPEERVQRNLRIRKMSRGRPGVFSKSSKNDSTQNGNKTKLFYPDPEHNDDTQAREHEDMRNISVDSNIKYGKNTTPSRSESRTSFDEDTTSPAVRRLPRRPKSCTNDVSAFPDNSAEQSYENGFSKDTQRLRLQSRSVSYDRKQTVVGRTQKKLRPIYMPYEKQIGFQRKQSSDFDGKTKFIEDPPNRHQYQKTQEDIGNKFDHISRQRLAEHDESYKKYSLNNYESRHKLARNLVRFDEGHRDVEKGACNYNIHHDIRYTKGESDMDVDEVSEDMNKQETNDFSRKKMETRFSEWSEKIVNDNNEMVDSPGTKRMSNTNNNSMAYANRKEDPSNKHYGMLEEPRNCSSFTKNTARGILNVGNNQSLFIETHEKVPENKQSEYRIVKQESIDDKEINEIENLTMKPHHKLKKIPKIHSKSSRKLLTKMRKALALEEISCSPSEEEESERHYAKIEKDVMDRIHKLLTVNQSRKLDILNNPGELEGKLTSEYKDKLRNNVQTQKSYPCSNNIEDKSKSLDERVRTTNSEHLTLKTKTNNFGIQQSHQEPEHRNVNCEQPNKSCKAVSKLQQNFNEQTETRRDTIENDNRELEHIGKNTTSAKNEQRGSKKNITTNRHETSIGVNQEMHSNDRQKSENKKEDGTSRKDGNDTPFVYNQDEVIQCLNKTKLLLMSTDLEKKMLGVTLFHAIVKSFASSPRMIQFILNENILSFITIEIFLASESCTENTCAAINIIAEHSGFYANQLAKDFLHNLIRTLDVSLEDRKYDRCVPLLFETIARIIARIQDGTLSTIFDRTKMFMCVQKVQNLIGLNRLDLHRHSLNIVIRMVTGNRSVDKNLVRMIANIKDITNNILTKVAAENVDDKIVKNRTEIVKGKNGTDFNEMTKGKNVTDFSEMVNGARISKADKRGFAKNKPDRKEIENGRADGKSNGKTDSKNSTKSNRQTDSNVDEKASVKQIEQLMMSNARLFEECARLYEAFASDVQNKKEYEVHMKNRNEALLFLMDDQLNEVDKFKVNKTELNNHENVVIKRHPTFKENDQKKTLEENEKGVELINDMQELYKTIVDNYNDNIMHESGKTTNLIQESPSYSASTFEIVCILLKYSTLSELKTKQTLRAVLEIMDRNVGMVGKHKGTDKRFEANSKIRGDENEVVRVIGNIWTNIGKIIFKANNGVDVLLNENIKQVLAIPRKRWLKTLTNDNYDIPTKFTILVLVYSLYFCKLQVHIFPDDSLEVVFQSVINETDLPNYMVKIFLFLACVERKSDIIMHLNCSIEELSDFTLIDTDHDILLANWDHFRSNDFKMFIVFKYLSHEMTDVRKKFFQLFAMSNMNLLFTLTSLLLEKPMDESFLEQIANIVIAKVNKSHADQVVDTLWNCLTRVFRNYDPLFFNNVRYFTELCLGKLPRLLQLESNDELETSENKLGETFGNIEKSHLNDTDGLKRLTHRDKDDHNELEKSSHESNNDKLNKLTHIADLLAKFIVKIEIREDNLALLMQLETLMFLILKQTKQLSDERILQCNLKSNLTAVTTETAVLLKDISAIEASKFTAFYLSYTNDIMDLCNKHQIQFQMEFNYELFFKQIINADLVYMEQLLKLLQTLFISVNKPLLSGTISNFTANFIQNENMYAYVYTYLLNLLIIHGSLADHVLKILTLMLKLNGDAIQSNPFNYTIVRCILKNKFYCRYFLVFVNQLLCSFVKNFVDTSRCLGKPRRQLIVESVQENMNELTERYGDKGAVMKQLQNQLAQLSVTSEDSASSS
uniref:Uncharacterized protein n=1 Tax=Cacopsylla melanoneura TaxID=428564 RepID=A0A8D8RZA8_9HEMI